MFYATAVICVWTLLQYQNSEVILPHFLAAVDWTGTRGAVLDEVRTVPSQI